MTVFVLDRLMHRLLTGSLVLTSCLHLLLKCIAGAIFHYFIIIRELFSKILQSSSINNPIIPLFIHFITFHPSVPPPTFYPPISRFTSHSFISLPTFNPVIHPITFHPFIHPTTLHNFIPLATLHH